MVRGLKRWLAKAWPLTVDRMGELRRTVSRWARFPQDGVTAPRWVRYLLVLGAVLVTSAAFGISSAQTKANFGPHDAHYEVTVDSVITLDVGPLGTVQLESPLPLGLGVRATISEIPTDFTSLESSQTLGALGEDLDQYLQFFASPNHTIDLVTKLLIEDAITRSLLAAGVVLVGLGAISWLLGPNRRRELAYPLARRTWPLTAGFVIAVLIVGQTSIVRSRAHLEQVGASTSAVFVNTPLEGARITGRLSGVIDTYGGQLLAVYEENERFYAQATVALEEAFDTRRGLTQRSAEASNDADRTVDIKAPPRINLPNSGVNNTGENQSGGVEPDKSGSTADQSEDSPSGVDHGEPTAMVGQDFNPQQPNSPSPEESSTPEDPEWEDPKLVTMLVVSDLHCNVGMSPLITAAAERSEASIILNAGDTTVTGTELERFCVESFVSAAPKGVDFVQADGNHDSAETSKQAAKAGAIVLDGEVVEVQGIHFLGDSDPNATRIGTGSVSVRGETYETMGNRLTEVACAAKEVDILLIHTPNVGIGPLASGCVPYQISGHLHRRVGPSFEGQGVRYTNSSTAGAIANKATIGPLNGTAEMTVLTYDTANNAMVSMQIISVTPSATAVVGPALRFPQPGDNQ